MPPVTSCILAHLHETKNTWIAKAICSSVHFQGFTSQQEKHRYAQEEHWSEGQTVAPKQSIRPHVVDDPCLSKTTTAVCQNASKKQKATISVNERCQSPFWKNQFKR